MTYAIVCAIFVKNLVLEAIWKCDTIANPKIFTSGFLKYCLKLCLQIAKERLFFKSRMQ